MASAFNQFFNPFCKFRKYDSFNKKMRNTFYMYSGRLLPIGNPGDQFGDDHRPLGFFDLTIVPTLISELSSFAVRNIQSPNTSGILARVLFSLPVVIIAIPRILFAAPLTFLSLPFVAIAHGITKIGRNRVKAPLKEEVVTIVDNGTTVKVLDTIADYCKAKHIRISSSKDVYLIQTDDSHYDVHFNNVPGQARSGSKATLDITDKSQRKCIKALRKLNVLFYPCSSPQKSGDEAELDTASKPAAPAV